jgi:hypothetical protein
MNKILYRFIIVMSDTSAIDDKKNKSEKPKNALLKFSLGIFYQLITLGIIILIGSLFLYTGKVAQSNLLPTCLAYVPYTDTAPPIKEIPIDINVVKTEKGTWSTKLKFPLEENLKTIEKTLGALKSLVNGPKTNVFKMYIGTTLQEVVSCNFNIINTIYNFINAFIPETLIVLLGPFLGFFIYILTGIIDTFYLIFLWFYNIHLLFSEKTETNTSTSWKSGDMWGILTWYWSLFYIFLFIIAFFLIGMGLIIPILSFLISTFCLFFPLFMKSKNATTGKSYGLGETIKNILKFKMSIIMILMSLNIIISANSNFGGYTAFVAIVACVLLYFFTSIYKPYTPKGIDHSTFGLGDYAQAEKVCEPTTETKGEPSLLEKIENLFGGSKRTRK